jgi:orotate phosphoribosyltransferase
VAESVVEMFKKSGALLSGHFLLTSGLHSPEYWEKAKVLQYPVYTEQLCRLIADRFHGADVSVVAGPTTPGIILAYETARQLGVRGIFAEKDESGGRVFRRGFEIAPGERVLVVDDVMTTGGSLRDVIAAVKQAGGTVAGVGVLVYRPSAGTVPDFGAPFFACHTADVVTYPPDACPLCNAGLPLVKPGSSRQPGT